MMFSERLRMLVEPSREGVYRFLHKVCSEVGTCVQGRLSVGLNFAETDWRPGSFLSRFTGLALLQTLVSRADNVSFWLPYQSPVSIVRHLS